MRSSQCAGADSSDVLCAGAWSSDVLCAGADSSDVLCAGAWSSDVLCAGADSSDVLCAGVRSGDASPASAAPATAQASVRAMKRSLVDIALGLVRWFLGGGTRFAGHERRQQIAARDG